MPLPPNNWMTQKAKFQSWKTINGCQRKPLGHWSAWLRQSSVQLQNRGILSEKKRLCRNAWNKMEDMISRGEIVNPQPVSYSPNTPWMVNLPAWADHCTNWPTIWNDSPRLHHRQSASLCQYRSNSHRTGWWRPRQSERTKWHRYLGFLDKAEFTPKTIQTKDERANRIYAVLNKVKNDGSFQKIGMYGRLNFDSFDFVITVIYSSMTRMICEALINEYIG